MLDNHGQDFLVADQQIFCRGIPLHAEAWIWIRGDNWSAFNEVFTSFFDVD